jgi:WD40 repeat protein
MRIIFALLIAQRLVWPQVKNAGVEESGPALVQQRGHVFKVVAGVFSRDARYVATGSIDGEIVIWEAATGLERTRITGPKGLRALSFSPDGRSIVAAGQETRLWNIENGSVQRSVAIVRAGRANSVGFSPNGLFVVIGGRDLQVWSIAARQAVEWHTIGKTVEAVAFSPDGKYLAVAGDGVRLFEFSTGREVRHLSSDGPIKAVAFSPDGRNIVAGGDEITMWDLEGRLVGRVENGSVISVAFSPDGRIALAGGSRVVLFDTRTFRIIRYFPEPESSFSALSPDGRSVLVTRFEGARLYDTVTGRELFDLSGKGGIVWDAAFSPDGRYILTAGDSARLWDLLTGQEIQRFPDSGWVNSVAFSSDGKYFATGGEKAIRWNISDGTQKHYGGQSRDIRAVAFSPDGKFILTGSGDSVTHRDGSDEADHAARLWDAESEREIVPFEGHTGSVSAVVFSPDGSMVLTGSEDRTARVWDVKTGREIQRLSDHLGWVRSVAFSPIAPVAATGADDARVWDLRTGKILRRMRHSAAVFSVRFSRDGHRLLTAGADNSAHEWDVDSGKEIRQFTAHSHYVISAVYADDGRMILTASADGTAMLWRESTGERIGTLRGAG